MSRFAQIAPGTATMNACHRRFDAWRDVYNLQRPHEALNMAVPMSRYRESPRSYPETLLPIEYPAGDQVRKVTSSGDIRFRGHTIRVGKASQGVPIALRPNGADGVWDVYFSHCQFGLLHQTGLLAGPHGVTSFICCAHSRQQAVTS